MRRLVVAIVAVLSGSCVPFVQHGPWVHSGASGGGAVAGSVFRSPQTNCHSQCVNVGIDFAVREGFVPRDTVAPAFAAGLTVPMWTFLLGPSLDTPSDMLQFISADAYVTGPRTSKYATALGLTASEHHAMPYVQFGTRAPGPKSWYVTQALLILPSDRLYLWMPSYTFVNASKRSQAEHVNLGFGVGSEGGQTLYLFNAGITVEFFHKDARVR